MIVQAAFVQKEFNLEGEYDGPGLNSALTSPGRSFNISSSKVYEK
jgi:hypothetical protein